MSFVKRILSLILALVLVIGLLPVTARAGELDNGLEYEIYEDHVEITDYTGDATEIVKKACEENPGYTRIYACGGDGTLNEAVSGMVGAENAALCPVPIGSGNDFIIDILKICEKHKENLELELLKAYKRNVEREEVKPMRAFAATNKDKNVIMQHLA